MSDLPPPPPPQPGPPAAADRFAEPERSAAGHTDPTTPSDLDPTDIDASGLDAEPLDDRERKLDPRMVIVWRVFGGLSLLFPLTALSVAGYLLVSPAPWAVPATAAIVWIIGVTWYPGARYRAWHWRLTDIALELRYGVLVHRHEAVPYFRVQQIDISQGPFDRLLGLATLQVTTASASGSAGLPGIPAADAPQIRMQLLARAAVAVREQPDEVRDAV
ncbi:MAG: hypothetical protein EA388_12130 [Nitriliruptor sp.]|nr:MAG: hypothetical protein EA388_12130 [Nitriliruptor sp.]